MPGWCHQEVSFGWGFPNGAHIVRSPDSSEIQSVSTVCTALGSQNLILIIWFKRSWVFCWLDFVLGGMASSFGETAPPKKEKTPAHRKPCYILYANSYAYPNRYIMLYANSYILYANSHIIAPPKGTAVNSQSQTHPVVGAVHWGN